MGKTFEHEYTNNNLIKSDFLIERIWMKGELPGTCLVLDRVNNIQERKQSPLVGRIERSVNGKCPSECGGV